MTFAIYGCMLSLRATVADVRAAMQPAPWACALRSEPARLSVLCVPDTHVSVRSNMQSTFAKQLSWFSTKHTWFRSTKTILLGTLSLVHTIVVLTLALTLARGQQGTQTRPLPYREYHRPRRTKAS